MKKNKNKNKEGIGGRKIESKFLHESFPFSIFQGKEMGFFATFNSG